MLSKFQTIQCEINTQFEVCYCSDLTLTADKHLLNNESEMCVGPTADSPLKVQLRSLPGYTQYGGPIINSFSVTTGKKCKVYVKVIILNKL